MKRVFVPAVAVGVVLASGCSVSGNPGPALDLSARALPAAEFPYGTASTVPPEQVPGAVADITQRPLRGDVTPATCTPAAVDDDTATILVGPGPDAGGTLTEMVVRTAESLRELASAATECATFTGGSTGTQEITSVVLDEPRTDGDVDRMWLQRTLQSQGLPTATVLDQWIAQRGDIRVLVQLRSMGTATTAAQQSAETLFEAAVARAFS